MGSPMAPLDLTLKGQSQGHPDFEGLYLTKSLVRPYLTIKH